MCNTGMYLKLKNNGAVFKFTYGTSVFVKKNGDRYEIKKKRRLAKNEKE